MDNQGWDLQLLRGLLWAVLFVLFLSLSAVFLLSSRGLELTIGFRLRRDRPSSRRSLRAAMFTTGIMLVTVFCLEITAKESTVIRLSVLAISLIVVVVAVRLFWNRLGESIRRRLDQSTYWQRRALEIGGSLDTIESSAEIRTYVLENLATELDLHACALYERDAEAFRCTLAHPSGEGLPEWPASALLPETLSAWLSPSSLVVADPATGQPLRWHLVDDEALAGEQERLRERDVRVAVGFRRNEGFAGFLLLSARSGNQPFSVPQLRFAESIAGHLARSLDHADRLERLMDISRDMERENQERIVLNRARGFLAQPERPEVPGAEYGWDYWRGQFPGNTMFDAMALPNRSLGFVLAEAEGSDLEAAIRLIQLQALLRSRFWAYGDDLREMLESTERALTAARNECRPLRLFCARYRPLTRTLHYVNAGYYAPMLLRVHAKGADILRLSSRSGPLCDPVRPALLEEEFHLEQGDLLAVASPGVAAARSPLNEVWGESRLADTLLSWEGQPVEHIARLTLRTVEEYTGKEGSQPSRSLVLLRLLPPAGPQLREPDLFETDSD